MASFTESLFGPTLVSKTGEVPATTALADCDAVGIYFSAHWCPPCRGFTPKLGQIYSQLKAAGKKTEFVFVSSDRDQSAFDGYHAEMPFLALPYSQRDLKTELSNKFGVSGIPTLVFIDGKTGDLITKNGRAAVSSPNFIEDFPYHPKPTYDLSESTEGIQDQTSLIVLCEASSAEDKASMASTLLEVALAEKATPTGSKVCRYFTGKGGGPVDKVRSMCGLKKIPIKHEHELISNAKATEDGLGLRVYPGSGAWNCDGCGCMGNGDQDRYRCSEKCDFDFCPKCYAAGQEITDEENAKGIMIILDIEKSQYYAPKEEHMSVTKENMLMFIQQHGAEELEPKSFQ